MGAARKPHRAAALRAWFGAAIVLSTVAFAACELVLPSEDSLVTPTGGGGQGGSGEGGAAQGGGSLASGSGGCDNPQASCGDDETGCAGCVVQTACASESMACKRDPECSQFTPCLAECGGGGGCFAHCTMMYPDAGQLMHDIQACVCAACPVSCGATTQCDPG